MRSRRRVGAKARARIRAGGPTSTHRKALSRAAYADIRAYVLLREGHRCLACRKAGRLEVHHVIKRSQGGADTPDGLVALCPACHRRTDAPYDRGRLMIVACGAEVFQTFLRYGRDKWTLLATTGRTE